MQAVQSAAMLPLRLVLFIAFLRRLSILLQVFLTPWA